MPSLRWSTRVAQLVAILAIGACLFTMLGRLGVACDLEWMTGSVHDSVDRIRAGKPLYVAPSVAWTPFLYPPLYLWIVARLVDFFPFYLAARSLSILGTLVTAGCIWRLARHHGASVAWSLIGLGVFAAAFGDVAFWYDLERADSLFVALMAVATVLLVEQKGWLGTASAGLVVGLGFFAKQPALVFMAGGIVALVVTRKRAHALVFAVASGAIIIAGIVWLQARTDGWFAYYVLRMPGEHGVVPSLFKVLFFEDVPRALVLVLATAFLVGRWLRDRERDEGVLACICVAAGIAAGSSRVHLGGWDNVLMFYTTFASVAVAITGTEFARRFERQPLESVVPALAALQMIVWAWNPVAGIPGPSDVAAARDFEARVRTLEEDGEVLVTGRGHVTTPEHAHLAALNDVFRAEHRVPEPIARRFRDRTYAAIVIDGLDDLELPYLPELHGELFAIVLANYFVAERLPSTMPDALVGYRTHPRYVLRRRAIPLDETRTVVLHCRADAERALAESRERAGIRSGDTELPAQLACDSVVR